MNGLVFPAYHKKGHGVQIACDINDEHGFDDKPIRPFPFKITCSSALLKVT